jgi:hypothetical protein
MEGGGGMWMAWERNSYRILVGKPEGRNNLKDVDVDGRIILKLTLTNCDGRVWN